MKFAFRVLPLLFLLLPANLVQAQIKNECLATKEEHLLLMERMPGHRYFCVDARFLDSCRGADNGKVTLVSSYQETDGLRGEFASSVGIYSKTDSQIKISPGRIVTAVKTKTTVSTFYWNRGVYAGYIHLFCRSPCQRHVNGTLSVRFCST